MFAFARHEIFEFRRLIIADVYDGCEMEGDARRRGWFEFLLKFCPFLIGCVEMPDLTADRVGKTEMERYPTIERLPLLSISLGVCIASNHWGFCPLAH